MTSARNTGTPVARDIAALFERGDVPVTIESDFAAEVWSKLAVNCVANPLSAILGVRNREIVTPELADIRRAITEEVAACARDAGVELPSDLATEIDSALARARKEERRIGIERDRLDISLPARAPWSGSLHPVTQTRRELERIFREMGFTVERGPEVEDDFHNFEALNLPPGHPARDETDTFYLENGHRGTGGG